MRIRALMTSSTQPNFMSSKIIELSWSKTDETLQTYSSTVGTLTVIIKFCYDGNPLFSSPRQSVFNILEILSSEK